MNILKLLFLKEIYWSTTLQERATFIFRQIKSWYASFRENSPHKQFMWFFMKMIEDKKNYWTSVNYLETIEVKNKF